MNANDLISRNSLAAAIAAALMASGAAPAALAQDQQTDAELGALEEVLVTATRRETTVQEIPYNISAVIGSDLEAAQIVTNNELIRAIPGASVVDRGHRNSGVINPIMIRGLNVESSAFGDYALSTVPTVSTYVNDTPIFANFIIKDLARVEVLRGPQGTLYGSGSLGGTVRYITNAPDPESFYGSVDAKYSMTDGSSGSNWSADVMLNIPMGETAAIRVVAGTIDHAGIVDAPNVYVLDSNGIPSTPGGILSDAAEYQFVKDADTVDIDYARISALFAPSDRFTARFTHQTQEDDIGGRRHVTRGNDGFGDPYGEYEIGSIQLEPSTREVDMTSLEMEFDLGFATLTSSTSAYEHEGDSTSENTGFYAQLNWLALYYYNYPRPMASAVRTYEDDAFIQEIRLVSQGDGNIDWIVGGFYQDLDQIATQTSYLRGWQNYFDAAWGSCYCVDDTDFRYNRDENFTETAIFGELTYHVSDQLRITGGFRYFDNDYENQTFIGVGIWTEDIFRTSDTEFFSGSESDTLFKLNFAYDLSDDTMLYGTYSEGFRRGGANAVPLSGIWANDSIWQRYDPDSVKNYELGVKGSQGNLRYTAALFFVDWENVQLNDASTNGAFFAAINGGSASTQGLELELAGYSRGGLNWSLGYAYVDATLDSNLYKPDDYDQDNPIAFGGDRLPGTSEHTFNVGLNHTREFSGGRSLTTRISGYWQSDIENHINRDPRFAQNMGGFALWDASATLGTDSWDVTFFVKNLFNEEGITGMFKEEYMGTSPEQHYFGNGAKQFLSLPRTFGVAFGYDF